MAKWTDIDHVVTIFALTAFVPILFAAYKLANSGWTVFQEVTAVLAVISFMSILFGLYKAARFVWRWYRKRYVQPDEAQPVGKNPGEMSACSRMATITP